MRLLIDTHILLWADERPGQITPTLRAAMRDQTNGIIVNAATVWEIAIKRAIGKLRFDRPVVAGYPRSGSRFSRSPEAMRSTLAGCRVITTIHSIG